MSVGWRFLAGGLRSFNIPPRAHDPRLKMPQTMVDKVKLMAGMEPDNPPELLDELNECFSLTRMQRLYGFVVCVSAGLFCSFLSSLMWLRPTKFAILYTMGNILSLGSTGFLTGFMAQAKGMFKGTRLVATCVYLGSMVRNGEPDSWPANFARLALTFVCFTSKHTRRPKLLSRS